MAALYNETHRGQEVEVQLENGLYLVRETLHVNSSGREPRRWSALVMARRRSNPWRASSSSISARMRLL